MMGSYFYCLGDGGLGKARLCEYLYVGVLFRRKYERLGAEPFVIVWFVLNGVTRFCGVCCWAWGQVRSVEKAPFCLHDHMSVGQSMKEVSGLENVLA